MSYQTKEVKLRPSLMSGGTRVSEGKISKTIRQHTEDGWELVDKIYDDGTLNIRFTGGVRLIFRRPTKY